MTQSRQEEIALTSLTATRAMNLTEKSNPERAVALGFVDLADKGHSRPQPGESYAIIPASSEAMANLPTPPTRYKRLDLDLFEFYSADMPDFWGANEGLAKVYVDTRDPQSIDGTPVTAAFVTKFTVEDRSYAPTFLYRGVFRNVVVEEWANLGVDLYEMDTDASVYYEKIKGVIDGVPEIKSLDVLKGIPYLGLATSLFDGIIKTFGKNPDDHLWGEIPILEVSPLVGGAFLRSGIYVLFERKYKNTAIRIEDLSYKDGRLVSESDLSNHLIFGLRLREHHAPDRS
jgi:hypothetical protein